MRGIMCEVDMEDVLVCRWPVVLKDVEGPQHRVAASTARAIRGRTRPIAAALSSDSLSTVATSSLGMTRVWPSLSGIDIEEGQHLFIFVDFVARKFAAQDLRKNRFRHAVTVNPADVHRNSEVTLWFRIPTAQRRNGGSFCCRSELWRARDQVLYFWP